MKTITAIMICNAAIEAAWVAATIVFVVYGHTGWAVATFIAALFSGYTYKTGKSEGTINPSDAPNTRKSRCEK